MKASLWTKLGVAAAVIAAGAACTVTTTNVDDGGLGGVFDSGGDSGGGGDSAQADSGDSGGGDANMCTLVVSMINNPACTMCLAGSCCAQVNGCFGPGPDGGRSDCADLQDCVNVCVQGFQMDAGGPDAGGQEKDCIDTCRAAHPDGVGPEAAWLTCLQASCKTPCTM